MFQIVFCQGNDVVKQSIFLQFSKMNFKVSERNKYINIYIYNLRGKLIF